MAQDFGQPITPLEEPKKKSNTGVIIAIVVIVLLCCCCLVFGSGLWLWNNGDRLLQGFNAQLLYFVL